MLLMGIHPLFRLGHFQVRKLLACNLLVIDRSISTTFPKSWCHRMARDSPRLQHPARRGRRVTGNRPAAETQTAFV